MRRHPLDCDESLADPYEAARRAQLGLPPRCWCLPGRPGDARHTALTAQQLWREVGAARTGGGIEG